MPPDTSAVTFIVPPIYLDDMDEDTPRLRAAASVCRAVSGSIIKTIIKADIRNAPKLFNFLFSYRSPSDSEIT